MEKDLSGEIIAELCEAMAHLTGGGWKASHALARVFYKEAEKNGADYELLSLIGSWGDTLPAEDMLDYIKDYNKNP